MTTWILLLLAFLAVMAVVGWQLHQATSQNRDETGLPSRRRFFMRQITSLTVFLLCAFLLLYIRRHK
ncbi:hypothetical protein PVA44_07135 (plasmid) [Entomospira nematocerorum]|uniref:Uncharacterized protein n=1 Tax=Entomospira nematocerorum TaxID=2719987 RepID=A0A968GH01_9SPIO|nr:hypothetical protein [Entomospira nematocera]NIZ47681.1 hypothetical protein [Entomospira nematocera]WDI34573.1 hypothetical protein PVA44_07135 [Entomospira nematocera]